MTTWKRTIAMPLIALAFLGACASGSDTKGSASPTPTQSSGVPAGWTSCDAPAYSVSYPKTWHTDSVSDETKCRWFDRNEFKLEKDSEGPVTDMYVSDYGRSYADAVAGIDTEDYDVTTKEATKIAGRDATRFERTIVTTDLQEPKGTKHYGYLVAFGTTAFVVMTTQLPDAPAAEYPENVATVDTAVRTLQAG